MLAAGGESAAADLVAKLGARAEVARELAYRLYTLCERRKRAAEALAYNGLVQSFPEIARLAPREREGDSRAGAFVRGSGRLTHGDSQAHGLPRQLAQTQRPLRRRYRTRW